jgi:hypothetical protein
VLLLQLLPLLPLLLWMHLLLPWRPLLLPGLLLLLLQVEHWLLLLLL